ncbi:MAB_1171c family putative transporter [Streptomyces sp. NBC_01465]|uniref:MAB_1171c family putative transporter n=1 Tax=Streptomyces sp. NBC_01465 TaxID=2903878 RepID=UPI002E30B0CD|nr:MAB_1171c family putative transporter [Streptomyces sp. NBC_01465]
MAIRLQCVLSGFLCVALLLKTVRLRHRPSRSQPTTMLMVALVCFTCAALAGLPAVRHDVPFEDRPGVASITMDTGVSISLALLATYLWRPLSGGDDRPWWRGRLFLAACTVSAFLALLMATTPSDRRTTPLHDKYADDWRIVGIYVVGNLFFLYCSGTSAVACVRITRVVHGHVAVAVGVGAVGMTAYAITCVNRLGLVVAQLVSDSSFASYSAANFVLTGAAILACVLGLYFVFLWRAAAALRHLCADLRVLRRLKPLWRRLTTLYPHVVLPPESGVRGLRDRVDISYLRYRCEIECQDALLLLSGEDDPGEKALLHSLESEFRTLV